MAQDEKTLEQRMVEILEGILVWTKVGMYSAVKTILCEQFGEKARPEELLAYELLDGKRSQKEIVEACKASIPDAKISSATLSVWTTKWEKLGLIKREGQKVTQLFSLTDFGLIVPKIADGKGKTKAVQQPDSSLPGSEVQPET